ncbi:hypothetical protein Syun_029379 [Stephania yunnanensis]|uniref:Uncharacterized protein n=1 Tax=Stephania yunnanensis TaxID=152371 RepID=A0AAP0HLB5_9MAGN
MNKEYLEEQAAKEAVTAAAEEAYLANFEHGSEELFASQELVAAAAAAIGEIKKMKDNRKELRQKTCNKLTNADIEKKEN